LVNISLAERAERAILAQGAVAPVVGLLSSDVPKLQQQAAMLLSNLLTNKEIRESVRYLGWVDPVISMIKNGDAVSVQQILRVIINITFDAHCRYLLASADAEKHVANASKRLGDAQVSQLSTTALKNLTVPAPPDVQADVEKAKSSGKIQGVLAPKANRRDAKSNDLEGLDDLIGDISGNRGGAKPVGSGNRPAAQPSRSGGSDGLDDLLGELNTPSSKPAPARSNPPPAAKPQLQPARAAPISKPAPKNDMGDLDDLLADVSSPAPKPQPAPAGNLSDIDDLLADIDAPKKNAPKPAPAPAKAAAPAPKASAPPPKSNARMDDIDDLLADIGTSAPPPKSNAKQAPPPKPKQDLDDIDDLLDGIGTSGNKGGNQRAAAGGDDIDDLLSNIEAPSKQSAYSGNSGGDDIDDLLNGLGSGGGKDPGMSAIDDLLNDLNG